MKWRPETKYGLIIVAIYAASAYHIYGIHRLETNEKRYKQELEALQAKVDNQLLPELEALRELADLHNLNSGGDR